MGLEDAGADGRMSQAEVMLEPKFAEGGLVFSMILSVSLGMHHATLLCQAWTGSTLIPLSFALDSLVWVYPHPNGGLLGAGTKSETPLSSLHLAQVSAQCESQNSNVTLPHTAPPPLETGSACTLPEMRDSLPPGMPGGSPASALCTLG